MNYCYPEYPWIEYGSLQTNIVKLHIDFPSYSYYLVYVQNHDFDHDHM